MSRSILWSSSIWASPSPLCVTPPPRCLPRCVHALLSRGNEYSSLARLTWRLASLVWARSAKTSRITSCRSITKTLPSSSQFLCCPGDISLSKMITSQFSSPTWPIISANLPLPKIWPGYLFLVRATTFRQTLMPRFSTNSDNSSRRESASSLSSSRKITESRKARSTSLGFSLTSNIMLRKEHQANDARRVPNALRSSASKRIGNSFKRAQARIPQPERRQALPWERETANN